MRGTTGRLAWCVGDYFQVVRSKIFENDVCFRFLSLLLDGAGLDGGIPGQVTSLGLCSLPTLQCLQYFMHSLSSKHIFSLEEDKLLNFIHCFLEA